MGDCPLKSVDWRFSQSTANPDFSRGEQQDIALRFYVQTFGSLPLASICAGKLGSNCLP